MTGTNKSVPVTINADGRLEGIDGWEGAQCAELTGGLTNRTWKVSKDGRHGVLKIDDAARQEPFNPRLAEAEIQRRAAAAGLAPAVITAGETHYFTDFVDGTLWRRPCLDKPGNLELIAAALKRVHALPLTGRTFDATIAARRYVAALDTADERLVTLATQTITSMRLPQNLCCCHNDLVAENLITIPELMFLDWEYACDNDPFFDLATIVEHHELSDDQAVRLLDAYFDGNGERWRPQLGAQQRLYLALLWLWMASRPDSDETELQRVGERLAANS